MNKIFALGMVLVLSTGFTGCVKNQTRDTVSTAEDIIKAYEKVEYDREVEEIEIKFNEPREHFGDNFVDYIGYDKDGNVVSCGGVSLPYAEYIVENS